MNLNHETVRVISHGSPPASPDLKFTRIAKRTWKAPKRVLDDLTSSVSTGNMLDEVDTPTPALSLRSLQSNDSIPFERVNFMSRNLKFSTVSPLAAVNTSTPASSGDTMALTNASPTGVAQGGNGWSPASSSKRRATKSEGESGSSNENVLLVSHEQQLRITGPLKRGQLDVVRRVTDKARGSPISSFILDSNLLDVSYSAIVSNCTGVYRGKDTRIVIV